MIGAITVANDFKDWMQFWFGVDRQDKQLAQQQSQFNATLSDNQKDRTLRETLANRQFEDSAKDRALRERQLAEAERIQKQQEALQLFNLEATGQARKAQPLLGTVDAVPELGIGMEQSTFGGLVPTSPTERARAQVQVNLEAKQQELDLERNEISKRAKHLFPDNPFRQRMYETLGGRADLMYNPNAFLIETAFGNEPDPVKALKKFATLRDQLETSSLARQEFAMKYQIWQNQIAASTLMGGAFTNAFKNGVPGTDQEMGKAFIQGLMQQGPGSNPAAFGNAAMQMFPMVVSRTDPAMNPYAAMMFGGQLPGAVPQQPKPPVNQTQQPVQPKVNPTTPPPPPRPTAPTVVTQAPAHSIVPVATKSDPMQRGLEELFGNIINNPLTRQLAGLEGSPRLTPQEMLELARQRRNQK